MSCFTATATLISATAMVTTYRIGSAITPHVSLVCDAGLGFIAIESADGFILYDKNNFKLVLNNGKL